MSTTHHSHSQMIFYNDLLSLYYNLRKSIEASHFVHDDFHYLPSGNSLSKCISGFFY